MKRLKCFQNFFLSAFLIIGFASQLQAADSGIPHYENYPPTPIVDYQEEILDFYSIKNSYGEFSNFALFPLVIDGVSWPTSEHYYQAHKYLEPELIEKVRLASTPMEAAKMGRDPNFPKRSDWDTYKDVAMEIAVVAKFNQYPVLQELLKSTNKSFFYEHTKNDCYWGDCGDRTGKNKLGLLLMKIRSTL
ncbi:MAG: NADAR family protein [Bacteriovoracaceae bacterium]|nr:NADAR family protein [Bacteriovoracaceae bacterium]